MSNHSPRARRVIALILLLAFANLASLHPRPILAAGNTENRGNSAEIATLENSLTADNVAPPQQVGQMIVTGTVTVNEKRAITGTTIFTESRIAVACARGNNAIVNLGRLGRIELTAGSRMMLRFTDGLISGDLLEGKAVVSTPTGVKVALNTPEGVSTADGAEATVTPVATQRGVRCVPVTTSGSSSSSVIGSGPLAAILVGIGGGVAAAAAVAAAEDLTPSSPRIGTPTGSN